MQDRIRAGLVACSNGEPADAAEQHGRLISVLSKHGVEVLSSPFLFGADGPISGSGLQRAEAVNRAVRDGTVSAVFDLSGGDMANEVLPYLDYDAIGRSRAELWGYSDLTTVLNAIYARTGRTAVLYQVKNLVGRCGEEQQRRFFSEGQRELFRLPVQFLRGNRMEGTLVGGNIRCLLKLAGTPFFPDLTGKLLLLEANSGKVPQMITYLSQLEQLGAFHKVGGVLLGTFTQMEREQLCPTVEQLLLERTDSALPVAKTELVGHGPDSRAVRIGGCYRFDA